MLFKVEMLKKRGNISHNDLAALGLGKPDGLETIDTHTEDQDVDLVDNLN